MYTALSIIVKFIHGNTPQYIVPECGEYADDGLGIVMTVNEAAVDDDGGDTVNNTNINGIMLPVRGLSH